MREKSTRDFVEALGSWYNLCLTGARAEADRVVLLARFEALTGRAQTALPRPAPLFLPRVRPFAVTREVIDRRPWEKIERAMREKLGPLTENVLGA